MSFCVWKISHNTDKQEALCIPWRGNKINKRTACVELAQIWFSSCVCRSLSVRKSACFMLLWVQKVIRRLSLSRMIQALFSNDKKLYTDWAITPKISQLLTQVGFEKRKKNKYSLYPTSNSLSFLNGDPKKRLWATLLILCVQYWYLIDIFWYLCWMIHQPKNAPFLSVKITIHYLV